ncbi:unnamed protein product [Mytilus edulis]|uniref:Uncharacterized protein n=1 Tax=Mytilus edulis TaxID=6550 RepID=A0A8S3VSK7_MYTED|nr:unnamed protein product [Mytilus edulis]
MDAIDNDKNCKILWRHLKDMNSTTKQEIDILTHEGKVLINKNDIANCLNDHFSTVDEKLISNPHKSFKSEKINNYVNSKIIDDTKFSLYTVTNDQVLQGLKNLDITKSTGTDGVGPRILKLSRSIVASPLAHIINLSLGTGIFPNILKSAKVAPIFKGGDKTDPNNYRPISILPTVSKQPDALLNTIWVNNTLHFGMRRRKEHIDMFFWRHKKDATASGEQCLEYNERMTKTRTEHCDSKAFAPKMFATPAWSYGDKLESYVRGLESLGQTPEMYCKYTGTKQEPKIQTAINVVETTDTTSVLHASQTVVNDCLATNIAPIVSWIHHEAEAFATTSHRTEYLKWWTSVAEKLKDKDYRLSFNLFTELGVDSCENECAQSLRKTQQNTTTGHLLS